ncbi:MAG: glycosyltransferase, partial [Opitutales bacterium]|nr:glycosyltransferase [Opitutales bacterium]
MKILLTSHGSTGDLFPVIALGRALRAAGHVVDFASAPLYRSEIERAGLGFRRLPPNWKKEIFAECMRALDREKHPILLLRRIYRSGLSFTEELIQTLQEYIPGYDMVLGSYVFPQYKELCDRHNVPFGLVTFCHSVVPQKDRPPDGIFPLPRGLGWGSRLWNRFWWKFSDRLIVLVVNHVLRDIRKKTGVSPLRSFLARPAELCLVGVSPGLMAPSVISPPYQFTGYLRWQSEERRDLDEKILAFTQGERVPVFTFGSVTFDHIPEIMGRLAQHWPEGQKLILQSGWAGLSTDSRGEDILVVGAMSHDQLFRHAELVVHHGGAGTTASVLHAGIPHLIIPHFGDQFFWGKEVCRLGVGVTLAKKKWPEKLFPAVRMLRKSPDIQKRAKERQKTLAQENGPATAVRAIEEFAQKRT